MCKGTAKPCHVLRVICLRVKAHLQDAEIDQTSLCAKRHEPSLRQYTLYSLSYETMEIPY